MYTWFVWVFVVVDDTVSLCKTFSSTFFFIWLALLFDVIYKNRLFNRLGVFILDAYFSSVENSSRIIRFSSIKHWILHVKIALTSVYISESNAILLILLEYTVMAFVFAFTSFILIVNDYNSGLFGRWSVFVNFFVVPFCVFLFSWNTHSELHIFLIPVIVEIVFVRLKMPRILLCALSCAHLLECGFFFYLFCCTTKKKHTTESWFPYTSYFIVRCIFCLYLYLVWISCSSVR